METITVQSREEMVNAIHDYNTLHPIKVQLHGTSFEVILGDTNRWFDNNKPRPRKHYKNKVKRSPQYLWGKSTKTKTQIKPDVEVYDIVINALTVTGTIELSEQEKDGIKKSFASRGSYQGYLKRDIPKRDNTLARACWLALQPNHYKISIGAVLLLSEEERTTHSKLNRLSYPATLDKDMETLKNMGVW